MTTKTKNYYVGVSETGTFVRTYEENETEDELVYTLFTSARKPTVKSHPRYRIVVGPFPTEASAIVFRDVFGVNTVEEAVRRSL